MNVLCAARVAEKPDGYACPCAAVICVRQTKRVFLPLNGQRLSSFLQRPLDGSTEQLFSRRRRRSLVPMLVVSTRSRHRTQMNAGITLAFLVLSAAGKTVGVMKIVTDFYCCWQLRLWREKHMPCSYIKSKWTAQGQCALCLWPLLSLHESNEQVVDPRNLNYGNKKNSRESVDRSSRSRLFLSWRLFDEYSSSDEDASRDRPIRQILVDVKRKIKIFQLTWRWQLCRLLKTSVQQTYSKHVSMDARIKTRHYPIHHWEILAMIGQYEEGLRYSQQSGIWWGIIETLALCAFISWQRSSLLNWPIYVSH
jgi:hypothetical protein